MAAHISKSQNRLKSYQNDKQEPSGMCAMNFVGHHMIACTVGNAIGTCRLLLRHTVFLLKSLQEMSIYPEQMSSKTNFKG